MLIKKIITVDHCLSARAFRLVSLMMSSDGWAWLVLILRNLLQRRFSGSRQKVVGALLYSFFLVVLLIGGGGGGAQEWLDKIRDDFRGFASERVGDERVASERVGDEAEVG